MISNHNDMVLSGFLPESGSRHHAAHHFQEDVKLA